MLRNFLPVVKNVSRYGISKLGSSGNVSSTRKYWSRGFFSELSSAMQSVEHRMRDMDREMGRIFTDIRSGPIKCPPIFTCKREVPIVSTDGNSRTYKLELDMHGMKPENINITIKDNELTITARREEKGQDGSRFSRESNYHYTLPKEIDVDTVRSSFSDGILLIEATLPELESKEIPIKVEKSTNSTESEQSKV